jgi:hypothetical protein
MFEQTPARLRVRLRSPIMRVMSVSEGTDVCERSGDQYRMHAVWPCAGRGHKTDGDGW